LDTGRTVEPPHCSRCAHAFVTHEPAFPHGCRAFEIKSARPPMLDVREASGAECTAYERKGPREAAR
jgi:hypothetical protein